jgi:hypothetical protein
MDVEGAVSKIKHAIDDMADILSRLASRLRSAEEDIDILFESQSMNVWVLARGISQGSIAPGESPGDVLKSMHRLQNEYKFCVGLASFLRDL